MDVACVNVISSGFIWNELSLILQKNSFIIFYCWRKIYFVDISQYDTDEMFVFLLEHGAAARIFK